MLWLGAILVQRGAETLWRTKKSGNITTQAGLGCKTMRHKALLPQGSLALPNLASFLTAPLPTKLVRYITIRRHFEMLPWRVACLSASQTCSPYILLTPALLNIKP
ncbi:hypothetical protein E2C01_020089 [Portunus trituberculatus]|uniref:Uncharacterized protein n=1 Tax=Portunus trituberculatus TaxID=210409 RepID=A0A5B7E0T1_PORTR|nr:hypothetical protein [Portunus trituberculatus]